MESILKALQMTEEEYEMEVFQNWFNWCGKRCMNMVDCQSLVANTALYNWWLTQYERLESDFLVEIEPFKTATKKDAYLLYVKNIIKIHFYYSKPLIQSAIKSKFIGVEEKAEQ